MEAGEGSGELGKIWERFGEPKKKEEGGGRERKKSIKVMLGPDTPEDTTPSIRGGRMEMAEEKPLPKDFWAELPCLHGRLTSDSWTTFLLFSFLNQKPLNEA